jgi:hypothetical protein
VVGVLESSEDGFNILLTSPKDVPATTAEAELTAEPWNEGTVQTGEPPSFHLRIWKENNRRHSNNLNSALPLFE